ncbi:endonuclease domain-containing protein [Methylorubrum aminovorans]|uniref:endonuclease domain-containing protein n=1 Tax=Methylorubrum aminovorans TaxID=269069 RepID=UPI0027E3E5DC|nr:DUF559 domain-containing protein [Methylorubrum aminovorans]
MRSAEDERRPFRKRLRHDQSETDRRLRFRLRDRRLAGFKFVRQESIGLYVADVCCREARLIVELDGSQHADSAYDAERDAWLVERGYRVLRFWNAEVSNNVIGVLDTILAALPSSLRTRGEGRDDLGPRVYPSSDLECPNRASPTWVVGATSPQGDGEGLRRVSLLRIGPLTPGCRLASATTRSPKPSPRMRGEGETLDDRLSRSDRNNPR